MTEPTTEDLDSFDSFSEDIRAGIAALGWRLPMPVQRRVIPIMRAGNDLIAQAMTGSGKTGAFGLPIVELVDTAMRAVQALVLAPTRELAKQIETEVAIMGRHRGVETLAVYGGTAYGPQIDAFARGVHVVVGTPGRLLDHLGQGKLKLDRLRVLVFDEADELLSLGFWPDMREIQKYLPAKRLTGLFSATMPARVQSLARVFLHEPVFAQLTEGGVRSPEEIEHWHYIVPAQQKEPALLRILKYEDPDSAIVFCNTRADTRFVTAYLQRHGVDADMIQGEMTQQAREKVMKRIKAGELRVLVATDVAARGIDISDLSHVISYSAPDSAETYMHRSGRTGRAGKAGTAISLVSGLDIGNFRYLQQVNRMTIPERKLPTDADVAERASRRLEVRLEDELRGLSEAEQRLIGEEYLPSVDRLTQTDTGRRLLAAAVYAYLQRRGRHVEAPSGEEQAKGSDPERGAPAAPARDTDDEEVPDRIEGSAADDAAPRRRGRRRRRKPDGAAPARD